MADDQEKTEVIFDENRKEIHSFSYAKAAMATEAKFHRNFCSFF
jgi:hypothetical protein